MKLKPVPLHNKKGETVAWLHRPKDIKYYHAHKDEFYPAKRKKSPTKSDFDFKIKIPKYI